MFGTTWSNGISVFVEWIYLRLQIKTNQERKSHRISIIVQIIFFLFHFEAQFSTKVGDYFATYSLYQ